MQTDQQTHKRHSVVNETCINHYNQASPFIPETYWSLIFFWDKLKNGTVNNVYFVWGLYVS